MQRTQGLSTISYTDNRRLPQRTSSGHRRGVAIMRPLRTLALVIAAALAVFPSAALAAPPGDHLLITAVHVDETLNTIMIMGQQFNFGPGPLVVTLGQVGNITSQCQTPPPTAALITCTLSGGLPPAGDYLLTVSNGTGQSQNDSYALTIGAVGPQGPKGATGPPGLPGTFTYHACSNAFFCACPFGALLIAGGGACPGGSVLFISSHDPPGAGIDWQVLCIDNFGGFHPATNITLTCYAP